MGMSMIYLGAGGYTVLVSCLPCLLNLHTVQYLVGLPNPGAGLLGLLAPSCSSPHRRPVVGLQKCTVTFSISPRLPDLSIARDQTSIISTSPQAHQGGQAAQDGLSSSPFMLLVSKMHCVGLD